MSLFPSLYLSHGAPTLALEPGNTGAMFQRIAGQMPKPAAIIIMSAHWMSESLKISSAIRPETIHDFGGFPEPLYQMQYPAPGAPELALQVQQNLEEAGISITLTPRRGLDHGAWVPLRYLYPDADIPVTQISLPFTYTPEQLFALGQALRRYAAESVLIIGSGSFTHNLKEVFSQMNSSTVAPYVMEFRQWMIEQLITGNQQALFRYRELAPHARRAHPTDEHLLPLYFAMGAADDTECQQLHDEVMYGSLSMDAFAFGSQAKSLSSP